MIPASLLERLTAQLPEWLQRQRWFLSAAEAPRSVTITDHEILLDAPEQGPGADRENSGPILFWTIVETDTGARYQVPVGVRIAENIGPTLLGHEFAQIDKFEEAGQQFIVYDALIDPDLNKAFMNYISGGKQPVKTVRPIGAEQSNTSLVYDNRLILKIFRGLYSGANPDLEVTHKLTEAGYNHVAPVVLTWQRDDLDLAVCQQYLWDGTEGWKLALASVRDFLSADTQGATSTAGSPVARQDTSDPAKAGGDFAGEAERLGAVTAGLHLALSKTFPVAPYKLDSLVNSLTAGLTEVTEAQRPALERLITRLKNLDPAAAGSAVRVHGDFHLGQTLRSVSGWYVFDFEGEPARPLSERTLPASPLKDVAGMLRSFQYAAATVARERMPSERDIAAKDSLAWETRNREAFCDGYFGVEGISEIVPIGEALDVVLAALEVEKAIYELQYERAFRPDWVDIPESGLSRLLL